jgi:carboxyl-terminal processing protease
MKGTIVFLLVVFFQLTGGFARQGGPQDPGREWTGTTEQKIWGLMTVWAQTKACFPHVARLQELKWDEKARECIGRVIAADTMESYYMVLLELVARLRDSHTYIIPPWGRMTPGYDMPPLEIGVVGERFYVLRAGESDELAAQRIYPGLEILEIGDHVPIRTYFNEEVLRFYTRGSKQADEAVLVFYLLYGPREEKVRLQVRDTDGGVRNVLLTRNSSGKDGAPFMVRFLESLFAPSIQSRMLADGVCYVNVPNFEGRNTRLADDFRKLVDSLDPALTRGLILDLRYNSGGSGGIAAQIAGCLIDRAVSSPKDHYFRYTPANIPWREDPVSWTFREWEIAPRDGKRYLGPLVLLCGPATHSSAEDLVIELTQGKRALTVGERTAGGAGGKLSVALPGGGELCLSTFKATFPDGREYMGMGIQPDVEVRPTLDDIVKGNDPVLEKACEVIRDWDSFSAGARGN